MPRSCSLVCLWAWLVPCLIPAAGDSLEAPGHYVPDFKAQPTARPQSRAEIKPVLGVPTLVIDGKPYGPMMYTRCAGSLPQIAQIADHRFPVHFEMVGSIGWPEQQQSVLAALDDQLHRFLNQVPNARLILRLYVCNPRIFARDYPDELLRFNDGSTQHFKDWYAEHDFPPQDRGYPSFASKVWRQKTAEALYEYVTHVRQADYAQNVIGYFLCGGGTEEWYYWGYDHEQYALDFSSPMLRAFRAHLRWKYDGDVAKLRAAWHDERVDFASAVPPDPQMRNHNKVAGSFWPESVRNHVRDYYEIHNKAMEDALLIFARAVKQACDRQQLVGMFHGYLQNHWYLEGGQATLYDVLDSPDIDFWSGPPQYDRRWPGEHGCIRFPIASLKQHGKLWISESDIRTSFSEPIPEYPSLQRWPPDVAQSLACMKREFAHQLCEGANGWWFQMGPQWYHHPPILEMFDRMQTVGEASTALDRTSETDIASVVDLKSLFVTPSFPISGWLIDAFKVQELCRLGAPVDHYELRDILAPGAKRYKLYLMLNGFSLSEEERRLIDRRLRRDGAILVWMYAPGWFNPSREPEEDPRHSRQLLGFPLRTEISPWRPLTMKLTAAGADYFQGFDAGRAFGSFERPRWEPDPKTGQVRQVVPAAIAIRQRFYGDAPGEVLARFVDGQQPSIVMGRRDAATDLWTPTRSSTPTAVSWRFTPRDRACGRSVCAVRPTSSRSLAARCSRGMPRSSLIPWTPSARDSTTSAPRPSGRPRPRGRKLSSAGSSRSCSGCVRWGPLGALRQANLVRSSAAPRRSEGPLRACLKGRRDVQKMLSCLPLDAVGVAAGVGRRSRRVGNDFVRSQ
jgi:hypothetical protein